MSWTPGSQHKKWSGTPRHRLDDEDDHTSSCCSTNESSLERQQNRSSQILGERLANHDLLPGTEPSVFNFGPEDIARSLEVPDVDGNREPDYDIPSPPPPPRPRYRDIRYFDGYPWGIPQAALLYDNARREALYTHYYCCLMNAGILGAPPRFGFYYTQCLGSVLMACIPCAPGLWCANRIYCPRAVLYPPPLVLPRPRGVFCANCGRAIWDFEAHAACRRWCGGCVRCPCSFIIRLGAPRPRGVFCVNCGCVILDFGLQGPNSRPGQSSWEGKTLLLIHYGVFCAYCGFAISDAVRPDAGGYFQGYPWGTPRAAPVYDRPRYLADVPVPMEHDDDSIGSPPGYDEPTHTYPMDIRGWSGLSSVIGGQRSIEAAPPYQQFLEIPPSPSPPFKILLPNLNPK